MKYKGAYSDEVSYAIGDVVIYTDGVPYCLQATAVVGTKPHDTLYWDRMLGPVADCVVMFHDMFSGLLSDVAETSGVVDEIKDVVDTVIFDSKTLILESSTEASTKKYAITVDDDDGLAATEIEAEGADADAEEGGES